MAVTPGSAAPVLRRADVDALGRLVVAGSLRKLSSDPQATGRVLGSFGLVVVTEGGGAFSDALGTTAVVSAGDALLLFPDVAHSYGPRPGGAWTESYLVFEGPVFDLWRSAGVLDARRPLLPFPVRTAWVQRVGALATRPVRRWTGDDALADVCEVQSLLAELVAAGTAATLHGGGTEDQTWLAAATRLLREDVRRERPLDDVARELSVSYAAFRRRFRALAGMSPGRYRSLAAVEQACALMATTTLTDRAIAAELGYSDEFHFSHRFTALAGRTPRAYRNALR